MHIHKPGHSGAMTRGGWMQSSAPLLMHGRVVHACWPIERWLQPRCPVCNQNALKAQFNVLSSVCIVLVKAPLYSDSSGVLRSRARRVCQTDTFVCMQNAHSRHLGSRRGLRAEYKSSNRTTSPKWTTGFVQAGGKVGGKVLDFPAANKKMDVNDQCPVGKPLEEIYIKTRLQPFKTPWG